MPRFMGAFLEVPMVERRKLEFQQLLSSYLKGFSPDYARAGTSTLRWRVRARCPQRYAEF